MPPTVSCDHMNAYLDERFPTLAAVSELIDGEAARIEALKQSRESHAAQLDAEARDRHAKQREQSDRRIRAAIDRDSVSTSQFPSRIAYKIEEVRRLKTRQRVLELAHDAATYLQDPDANAFNLSSVLSTLNQLSSTDELASGFHAQIVQKWWQPRMDKYTSELRAVLKAAGWPRSNPTAGSATVNETLKTCLDFELDGSVDMQTFQVMAEPLAERIAFNFRPGQDTAREDRPDWLFGYVFKIIDPHVGWLNDEVRAFVDKPVERLLRALSPAIVRTLHSTFVLDAHFVNELLKFASSVESRLWISRETVDNCIVAQVLDEPTLVQYLDSENQERIAALEKIHAAESGSHTIDIDADVACAKPPFSSENSWQLIVQTMPLLPLNANLVTHKIQIPLVEHEFAFWNASLDAYNRSHSSLARAVGGHHDMEGSTLPEMPDIDYLAQIFGATAYFEMNLEILASQLEVVESGWAIRDNITKFAELRAQSAQKLAHLLVLEAQKHLRPYLRIEWSEPEDHTHRLRAGIDGLNPHLAFISKLCSSSRADRARVFVEFANSLAEIIWRVIINANVFTPTSASELRSDLGELWAKCSLMATKCHLRNIAATYVLETGEDHSDIQKVDADGLRRRRKIH